VTTTDRPELKDPAAYIAAITAKAEGRDPLEVLAETPERLRERLQLHPAKTLRARPFPGKWTPLEVAGHLAVTEHAFGYRTRTIFCDEKPALIGVDQDRWVERLRLNEREPESIAQEFADLRRHNLAFWKTLGPDDLARVGVHSERGEESLGLMLPLFAGHDLWHLEQFDRYAEAAAEV